MSVRPHSDRSGYTSGMSFHRHQINSPTPARPTPSWRWVAVLFVSILLHCVALDWATGVIIVPKSHDAPEDKVAIVQLQAPLLPAPATEKPKPAAKPRPHPHRVAKAAPKVTPEISSTALTSGDTTDIANAGVYVPPQPTAPASEPAVAMDDTNATIPVEQTSQPHYKTDLPPSVELKYDVKKVSDKGSPYYGSGTISWQSNAGNYQIIGEAHVLFITALRFNSEGKFDDFGVAPALYNEKRLGRSETNTHFNRDERNSISFSASTISYPLKGGEQDRASIMWELAAIGRGDPEKFQPGAQIDLFVASVRDGDIWSILVAGQEEIETGAGKTLAWHVVRTPRPGTYEHKIDIWLAPQFQWSPVRILDTEKNGDYTDMSMTAFHALQVASTPTDLAH
jgi:hypothetical protein